MKMLPFLMFFFLSPNIVSLNAQSTDHVESPYFVVAKDQNLEQFPLLETKAKVIITGAIADVVITQKYANTGTKPIEAVYTFPASTRAAIYHMEMHIGDRILKAEIQEKGVARKMYNEAKEEGKRTSLLEQYRPNVFQMNVANIMPGDEISIDIRYTEFLIPEDQKYQFVYPTVVGPRYTGEDHKSPTAVFASMPYSKSEKVADYDFDLKLVLNMGIPLSAVNSNTHQVDIQYSTPTTAKVTLAAGQKKSGNKDFVLEYKLAGNEIETGLLTFESGDENFFLIQLEAPEICNAPKISPREYIFVVDVSGSMNGFPLETSKALMKNLLTDLRQFDKFNIMFFAGSAYSLSEESLEATPANIQRSVQVFNNMRGGGGTNMLGALKKAMALPKSEGVSRSFVIVTDGYVTVEEEAFRMIAERLNEANFFALGIGESVNRHLMEGIAHVGRAEPFIVLSKEQALEAAAKLKQYIEYPVMTDISLAFDGVELYDIQPASIPDLMAKRPIYLFGKYKNRKGGSLTIRGIMGDELYYKKINIIPNHADTKGLSYLWAREKIRYLDDFNSARTTEARIKEITDLGLKYNLLTKYTSFVAIDDQPVRDNDQSLTSVKQPLPMPSGVPNSAVGFEMDLGDIISNEADGLLIVDVISIDISTKMMVEAVMETFLKQLKSLKNLDALVNNEFNIHFDGSKFIITSPNHIPDSLKKDLIQLLEKAQLDKIMNEAVKVHISKGPTKYEAR